MPIFHVIINKPSKILDFDVWEGKSFYTTFPRTEAYITTRNEEHLAQKMEKLYKGFSFVVKSSTIQLG